MADASQPNLHLLVDKFTRAQEVVNAAATKCEAAKQEHQRALDALAEWREILSDALGLTDPDD